MRYFLRKLLGLQISIEHKPMQRKKEVMALDTICELHAQKEAIDTKNGTLDMKKFLIAGLGNIGPQYANTRHNIGFKILDALAKEADLSWETVKLGDITTYKKRGALLFF